MAILRPVRPRSTSLPPVRHSLPRTAPQPRTAGLARWLGVVCAVSLCAFAHAQEAAPPLERVVAADCVRLLNHANPEVRGEAALIVAAEGSARVHDTLMAMARERDETARIYGVLALGLLASPGVTHVLRESLDSPADRAEPTGVAAAFALGLMPADQATGLVNEVLASFLRGSSKRQRDALVALLHGLQQHPQAGATTAMRRLFDEDVSHDPQVQAMLLGLLLPLDPTFTRADLARLLLRGSADERLAVLAHCIDRGQAGDAGLDAELTNLATRDADASIRAAALAAMTARRLPKTLDLAVDALAARDPRELSAAVHAVLTLGGARMRQVLEQHVLGTVEPARKAALLSAFTAPPSAALLDECARVAADRTQPLEVRRAAAFLLARAEPTRAAPMLRDLFREDQDPQGRRTIAASLMRAPGGPPPLARLLPAGDSLRANPQAWHPLLLVGHPEAERQLLALLEDSKAEAAELGPALRAWRCRVAAALPPSAAGHLPKPLARILADAP